MIEWNWQENPYQSNIFKLAEIPRSELRRDWIYGFAENAELNPQQISRVIEPDQRFEEELFAHLDHRADLSPLSEHARHFEELPITLKDLQPQSLKIRDPSGLINFSAESIGPRLEPVNFQLPSYETEGDADVGICLDY